MQLLCALHQSDKYEDAQKKVYHERDYVGTGAQKRPFFHAKQGTLVILDCSIPDSDSGSCRKIGDLKRMAIFKAHQSS